MNLKKFAMRLGVVALLGLMLAGCCVLPYGPRGHYGYDGHDRWERSGR